MQLGVGMWLGVKIGYEKWGTLFQSVPFHVWVGCWLESQDESHYLESRQKGPMKMEEVSVLCIERWLHKRENDFIASQSHCYGRQRSALTHTNGCPLYILLVHSAIQGSFIVDSCHGVPRGLGPVSAHCELTAWLGRGNSTAKKSLITICKLSLERIQARS